VAASPRGVVTRNAFDARVHTIRRRPERRRPFEVRWPAAGRPRSRSFVARGLTRPREQGKAWLAAAARQPLQDVTPRLRMRDPAA
jgi:hypothetical protein